MNQQTQPRTHYFYVAIAKSLFSHPKHGIVSTQDPIKLKDAEQYGLSPLILYGVTVAGLPIRWVTFTPFEQPRAFQDVLMEAWSKAEGLRGRPDVLLVNRHLALASPGLVQDMAKIGIQVKIVDAKEKALPASLRSAQKFSQELPWIHGIRDRSPVNSIQALCLAAQDDHGISIRNGYRGTHSRAEEDRIKKWLALSVQGPMPAPLNELDWKPGPWLSSWEASPPANSSRYFDLDGYGNIWLRTGEKEPEDVIEEEDFWDDNGCDNVAEIARILIACWPNRPLEIAECAGITLRKLQGFITGKAPLDQQQRFDLKNLLGIEYDEGAGEYVGVGPYVVLARNLKAIEEFYIAMSHGGDASPFEIIPHQGTADPSWRYVLINTCGELPSIVMAPRGAKIMERLSNLLLNYAGIKAVPLELYRDVVSTCGRACREPAANIREMTDFAKRYMNSPHNL